MNTRVYNKGDIIFRSGDAGESMFRIAQGVVGIYADHGTEKEKRLAELCDGAFFGEMGMIDHAPRSATAVALEDGMKLEELTEDDLGELLRSEPETVLALMRQLSGRLRGLTKDYMEACRVAAGVVRLEEKKADVTPEESDDIWAKAEFFSRIRCYGYDAIDSGALL
jgi:CRP-like cAMP-binding protein